MSFRTITGILGVAILLFSPVFVVPLVLAVFFREPTITAFATSTAAALAIGSLCVFIRREKTHLRTRDSFLIVSVVYVCISMLASLPFLLIPNIAPTFADAVFEGASVVTTTGATVLVGLDDMPRSLLFYRQFVCWFGGMGIILLTVAILPMLGVGGMRLVKAELPGDVNEVPVQLRVREVALTLWKIYVFLTIACALTFWLAGMTLFDAIAHAFSTISIGGFSTHDANIGYFDSLAIEITIIVFVIIAGCNFMLHHVSFHRLGKIGRVKHFFKTYLKEDEIRFYFLCLLIVCLLVCGKLWISPEFDGNILREGIFHSVSFMTTTGFSTADFEVWPVMCPVLLLFVSFIGSCSGSTGGGFKVFRILILFKQGIREIQQLIQPGAFFYAQLNGQQISDRTLESTVGFVAMYATTFIILLWSLMFVSSLELDAAFSAVAACLNNLGPGLGQLALNYQSLGAVDKYILVIAMILGRLEIFTLLVLFAPRYWSR